MIKISKTLSKFSLVILTSLLSAQLFSIKIAHADNFGVLGGKYFDTTSMVPLEKKTYSDMNDAARNTSLESSDCSKLINDCIETACMKKKKTQELQPHAGVYDTCSRISLNQFSDKITQCLVMHNNLQFQYDQICDKYIMPNIQQFLMDKPGLDKAYQSTKRPCIEAKEALLSARSCYAVMIKSNGGVGNDVKIGLFNACGPTTKGGSASMSYDFYAAGLIQNNNVQGVVDNATATGAAIRSSNWKELVEAVLASKIDATKSACNDENFEISQINLYTPTETTNPGVLKLQAAAAQSGIDKANGTNQNECRDRNYKAPVANGIWVYAPQTGCSVQCGSGYRFLNGSCIMNY